MKDRLERIAALEAELAGLMPLCALAATTHWDALAQYAADQMDSRMRDLSQSSGPRRYEVEPTRVAYLRGQIDVWKQILGINGGAARRRAAVEAELCQLRKEHADGTQRR